MPGAQPDTVYNVLFLCTGNSARSILAERLIEHLGGGRFRGHSAGSHPKGAPHPMALALLQERGHATASCRSKSWEEFALPGAPELHFIITVCDDARGETCPVWPGRPATAHWPIADPAACEGSDDDVRRGFVTTYEALRRRIELFVALPVGDLTGDELSAALARIGAVVDR